MDQAQRSSCAGVVLVVDDEPLNIELLEGLLEVDGHDVLTATDGPTALDICRARIPDVVLLDVMMPGIDGIETCRLMRQDPRLAATPILVVSAAAGRESRMRAIAAGADDFVAKPIDGGEMRLRVRNAVRYHQQHVQMLAARNAAAEAEAMRDALVHMAVHDLRSPLSSLLANLELLQITQATLDEEQLDMLVDARLAATRIHRMVDTVLDVNRLESGDVPLVIVEQRLDAMIETVVQVLSGLLGSRRMERVVAPLRLACDAPMLERVLTNLIANAAQATRPEGVLRVTAAEQVGEVVIEIHDDGPGVPPEQRDRIFDKYVQGEGRSVRRAAGSGLGLAFCRLATVAHGGRISMHDSPLGGCCVRLILPLRTPLPTTARAHESDRADAAER
ncbi:MAG: response regulator [Myxococcales bacterium]|nr:response regulator [Myxococcales bacterium]MCB9540392.1 response regulator [Myxococcales bacterium]